MQVSVCEYCIYVVILCRVGACRGGGLQRLTLCGAVEAPVWGDLGWQSVDAGPPVSQPSMCGGGFEGPGVLECLYMALPASAGWDGSGALLYGLFQLRPHIGRHTTWPFWLSCAKARRKSAISCFLPPLSSVFNFSPLLLSFPPFWFLLAPLTSFPPVDL